MSIGDRAEASSHRAKRLRDEWLASGVRMAASISAWVDDYRRIPVELMDEECFRLGTQVGKKLIGLVDDTVQADDEIVATLTQAKDDEEEYSSQWIAELELMMQAYDKKKKIDEDFERPSFILDGFEPGFFDTQRGDRGEGSRRADVAGTSRRTNVTDVDAERPVNQREEDGDEEEVRISDVEDTDEQEQPRNDHFADFVHDATDGGARLEPPVTKAAGNDPPSSTDDGTSKQKDDSMEERADGGGQGLEEKQTGDDVGASKGKEVENVLSRPHFLRIESTVDRD